MLLNSSGFQNMVFCCRLENLTETWLLLCIYCYSVITWIWNVFPELSPASQQSLMGTSEGCSRKTHQMGWYWYWLGVVHGEDGKGEHGNNLTWGLVWFLTFFFLFLFFSTLPEHSPHINLQFSCFHSPCTSLSFICSHCRWTVTILNG